MDFGTKIICSCTLIHQYLAALPTYNNCLIIKDFWIEIESQPRVNCYIFGGLTLWILESIMYLYSCSPKYQYLSTLHIFLIFSFSGITVLVIINLVKRQFRWTPTIFWTELHTCTSAHQCLYPPNFRFLGVTVSMIINFFKYGLASHGWTPLNFGTNIYSCNFTRQCLIIHKGRWLSC